MSTPVTGQQPGHFEDPNDPYRFGKPEEPVAAWGPSPDPWLRDPDLAGRAGRFGTAGAGGYAEPGSRTGRKAVWALVLGILSIFFFFMGVLDLVLIIPAIILASLALNDTVRGRRPDRSLAVAGLCCAIAGALIALAFTVWLAPKAFKCANEYPTSSAGYRTCILKIFK